MLNEEAQRIRTYIDQEPWSGKHLADVYSKASNQLCIYVDNLLKDRERRIQDREAVIAIGKEEKKLAEKADKEGRGDSVFRSGYLAGIDFVLDFIRNPKEADSSPLTTDSGEEEK